MRIHDVDGPLGAIAEDVDLSQPLEAADFALLEAAFDRRSVLCVRDQNISSAAFAGFARRFGPVERIFLSHYAHPDDPDIMLVSNIQENGRAIGHADAGRVWHTDMSYMARPPRATLLYALETPTEGGRPLGATEFASATRAYAALDAGTKDLIDGRIATHRVSGRRKSTGTGKADDAHRAQMPDVFHPVARPNPHTGERAIYVSEGECVAISGMDDPAALALVERLCQAVQAPEHRYRHEWREGDVLIWDNGAVQHRATFDYRWPAHRRLMWRVTAGVQAE